MTASQKKTKKKHQNEGSVGKIYFNRKISAFSLKEIERFSKEMRNRVV